MARVTMPDGRELDVADSDAALLAYYRGEGATVEHDSAGALASLPAVFDGEKYVDAGADPVVLDDALAVEGTGEPMVGYTVPPNADGTFGPATLGPDGATAEVDGQTVPLQPDAQAADDTSGGQHAADEHVDN